MNISWHSGVSKNERRAALKRVGATLWLTGLSASGKSTISIALENRLLALNIPAYRLDGDNIRHGLNKNLGFSPQDRSENVRRIGEVSKLFNDACVVAITAFISPYRTDRDSVRKIHNDAGLEFIEVFIDCPVEIAEKRDPKGLYEKARNGEIKEFTGISAPYEEPRTPEIHIKTNQVSVEEAVEEILKYLQSRGVLNEKIL